MANKLFADLLLCFKNQFSTDENVIVSRRYFMNKKYFYHYVTLYYFFINMAGVFLLLFCRYLEKCKKIFSQKNIEAIFCRNEQKKKKNIQPAEP